MSLPLLIPFNQLCLGARFRYKGGESCWVKISHNRIAEWDPSNLVSVDGWIGQRIRSFADDEKNLSVEVIVKPEKRH